MDFESPEFREFLLQVTIVPITFEIARKSTQLDFQSDPADEIISATSVVEKMPLLTRDRKLLKSKLVPLAKR
jgi:PIN domain nuclease of toxin-antitoxin system